MVLDARSMRMRSSWARGVTSIIFATAALVIPATISLSVLTAGPVAAASASRLCNGYSACSVSPYSTHGYQNSSTTQYWGMDPGNECTNYAAFVESTVYGVPTPGYSLGNGGDWATNAENNGVTVNSTPSVGSVAEWNANDYGMGPDGHVAIVEKVGPNHSYIEVSQQNIVTDTDSYDWEKINSTAPSNAWEPWPDNFIHFSGSGVPPPGPPTVTNFTASPSTLPATGGQVTLSANVTNATSCTFASNKTVTGLLTSVTCPNGIVTDVVTVPANSKKNADSYKFTLQAAGTKTVKSTTTLSVTAPTFEKISAELLVGSSTITPTLKQGTFPANILSDDPISGTGIPAGTTVVSTSPSSIVLSNTVNEVGAFTLSVELLPTDTTSPTITSTTFVDGGISLSFEPPAFLTSDSILYYMCEVSPDGGTTVYTCDGGANGVQGSFGTTSPQTVPDQNLL